MAVRVHGLAPREGDAAFAFLVLRLATPVDRAGLVDLLQQIAPLVPDTESFAAELPDDDEDAMRLIGMPWSPPEAGHAFEVQRRLIEGAALHGIAEAWFFQTGTSLPAVDTDDDGEGEADDGGDDEQPAEAQGERDVQTQTSLHVSTDDGWGDLDLGGDAGTTLPMQRSKIEEAAEPEPAEADDDGDDDDDNDDDDDVVAEARRPALVAEADDGGSDGDDEDGGDDDAVWSHGPPPQATQVRFPVDGYPEILEDLDWEDFGIAFKLGGPWTPGERTVLIGFHAMWLAPYGGRYRNAAVTIDQHHHAAHLWVDRFAVPSSVREQVHHLLWVVSKLDEVMPVVHARFGGATMAQKYGGIMGDTSEPFVLGGNPLIAVHTLGGEGGVDIWIAAQTAWSSEEVAQMLRELAIDLATRRPPRDAPFEVPGSSGAEADGDDSDEGDAAAEDRDGEGSDVARDDDDEAGGEHGGGVDRRSDDVEDAGDDAARSRYLTTYASELLAERARTGVLDPRVAELLRPVLGVAAKYEHRRTAAVSVLGAARDRDSVPAMIRILEDTPSVSGLGAIGKQDLVIATVTALGAIGDPAAIPALASRILAPGAHHGEPRAATAAALVACLTAAARPEHPGSELDDAIFAALARSIGETGDDEDVAELHLAYGALASALPPARRAAAHERLRALEVDDGDGAARLARRAALALALGGGAPPDAQTTAALRSQVHAALTEPADDHDATIRKIRIALRVAAWWSGLADPADLVWLTRLAEPDVRAGAHALLDTAGQRMPPATAFDRRAARALSDDDVVRWISEPHVVGRAALVAEAARRALTAARPAILGAAHAVIDRARGGSHNLLDPETRLLETAVAALRDGPLDADTAVLFDRMLRHANHHVKWELLQAPPRDERLIGGMFHVLGERWGWQEIAAKDWLSSYAGTAAYEAERNRASAPGVEPDAGAHGDRDDDNVN